MSLGSSVIIVTRLWVGRAGFDSDPLWGPPSFLSNRYRELFPAG